VIELESARRSQLIEQWAARLERLGLAPVAPLVLQTIRPLGFIGSQMLIFGEPFLTLFADVQTLHELSSLLDDPDALGQVEQRLRAASEPKSES
jgi:hypothetical protein